MSINLVNQTTGELSQAAGSVVTAVYSDAPVGSIVPFGGTTFPTGWLLCDGTELLRADYSDLFAVIGTSFGTPSADTKFKLPDLRGEFLRGAGNNSHENQGNGGSVGTHQDATELLGNYISSVGTFQVTDGPNNNYYGPHGNSDSYYGTSTKWWTHNATDSYAGTAAQTRTARPTNTSVNYIIKAYKTALPTDFTEEIDDVLAEIDDVEDIQEKMGAKNLLPNYDTSRIENGITFTKNSDGSVTFSGTATSVTWYKFWEDCNYFNEDIYIPNGKNYVESNGYILSSGTNIDLFSMGFTLSNHTVWIGIASGTVISEAITVYPMIRLSSFADDTYVPYALTNQDLTSASVTEVTLDSSYISTGSMHYFRLGRMIIVNINGISIKSGVTNITPIGTLPKPVTFNNYKVRGCLWTSLVKDALLEVAYDGKIYFGGTVPSTSEQCYGSLVYIARE